MHINVPRLLGLAFTIVIASGCFGAKQSAEEVAAIYFEAAQRQDVDKIMELHWPRFYGSTSTEDVAQFLRNLWAKLGVPGDYELTGWTVSTAQGGYIIELVYAVTYEKYPAVETLTVFKHSGEARLLGHNITSEGFLQP